MSKTVRKKYCPLNWLHWYQVIMNLISLCFNISTCEAYPHICYHFLNGNAKKVNTICRHIKLRKLKYALYFLENSVLITRKYKVNGPKF